MKSAGRLHFTEGKARELLPKQECRAQRGTHRPTSETDGRRPGAPLCLDRAGWPGLSSPCTCHLAHPPARPQEYLGTLPSRLGLGGGRELGKGSYSFATRGRAIRIKDGLPCTVRNTRIDAAQGHGGRPGRGQSELHPTALPVGAWPAMEALPCGSAGGAPSQPPGSHVLEASEATLHLFLIFWLSCKTPSTRKGKQCANKAAR